jgi:hypothetical protein
LGPTKYLDGIGIASCVDEEGREKKRIASCTASEDEDGFYSATHETAAFSFFFGGECVIVAWVPHACSHGVPECHVCMFMGKIFFAKE